MPYITKQDREHYEPELAGLGKKLLVQSKGDLTYLTYFLALKYIKKKGECYTYISNAISCLNDAAEELRRRYLNPYEDKKIIENGDIK